MTKNDTAWKNLFNEHPILESIDANGIYRISATTINTQREARLMTKFDYEANLPDIFRKNKLAILPDSRGSYVIGRFKCYETVKSDYGESPEGRNFPDWIASLAPDNLYSESSVLLCAHHAGLIADLLGEDSALTVFGRMSTGTFDFSIRATSAAGEVQQALTVDRAQCEIDGGFEGQETFAVLEVKNAEIEDFHIRQLYFPYRLWQSKLPDKRVVPVFMTYSNEVFTLSAYEFERPGEYNSLRLVKRRRYQIVPTAIELADIRQLLAQTAVEAEPNQNEIPFPQADSMERVIDLLTQLYRSGGSLTKEEVTTNYAFDKRQSQYYSNAARYLGLLQREQNPERGVFYSLTELGRRTMMQAPQARNKVLVSLILKHRVFREAVEHYLLQAEPPSDGEVAVMMARAQLSINETTRMRRASTVTGWVRWMMQLTAES